MYIYMYVHIYIYACIRYMDTRGCNASCDAAAIERVGTLACMCAFSLPYIMLPPLTLPFALSPDRPPSDYPHRPYSPHRYSLPAPLGVSRRRCRVLHNSRATLPAFFRQSPTLPVRTGVPCRTALPARLPACLSTYSPRESS